MPGAVDLAVVIIGNLMNLLLALMFLCRAWHKPEAGQMAGWAAVGLAIPLAVAVVMNFLSHRGWPYWLLPLFMIAYCLLELLFDGILKIDFRHNRLLGPYLAAYYLGLMAMIGYAFLVGKPYGFITLVTYFINLAATAYSYARVGHGEMESIDQVC
jgi:hypothetical protein